MDNTESNIGVIVEKSVISDVDEKLEKIIIPQLPYATALLEKSVHLLYLMYFNNTSWNKNIL